MLRATRIAALTLLVAIFQVIIRTQVTEALGGFNPASVLYSQGLRSVCSAEKFRSILVGANGVQCAKEAGYSSAYKIIRAKPTESQVQAMCASKLCRALLSEIIDPFKAKDCTMPFGNNIRLHADLVDYVLDQCSSKVTDTYTLMDCTSGTGSESALIDDGVDVVQAVWYYPNATNVSYVPDGFNKSTVEETGEQRTRWEGFEVSVATQDGWKILSYIDESVGQVPAGAFAGVLEASRDGLSIAYECSRGDDAEFELLDDRGLRVCHRRYICNSD
ncbi:Elicitin, partial [Globisporangium splendens]